MAVWGPCLLGITMAISIALASGQVAGQAEPAPDSPEAGALYLTDSALSTQRDDTCPDGQLRFELNVNRSRVRDGAAAASPLGNPAKSCGTRFQYPVTSAFTINGTAHVFLRIRCQTAVAIPGEFDIRLTNDPNYNYITADPFVAVSDPGRALEGVVGQRVPGPACGQAEAVFDLKLPDVYLDFAPGGVLTVIVIAYYPAPPGAAGPNMEFLTGGDDPSRIEAPGIPTPAAEATGLQAPSRPRLLWTATWNQTQRDVSGGETCSSEMPVYLMVPENVTVEAGTLASTLSTPAGVGCILMIDYVVEHPMALRGSLSVHFWFQCDSATIGSPQDFQLRFRRQPAGNGGAASVTTVATAARTGNVGSIGLCNEAPTEVTAESVMLQEVTFSRGDRFRVEITPFYANAPHGPPGLEQVQFLVGPDHPSSVAVAGLPWQPTLRSIGSDPPGYTTDGSQPAAQEDGARPGKETPTLAAWSGLAVVAAVAAIARQRSR